MFINHFFQLKAELGSRSVLASIHMMNQSLYILLQQAQEIWNTIWSFISNNASALNFLVGRGGIVLFIFGSICWLCQQFRKRQIRPDTFPFDVIKPQSDVLKTILGGDENDPLADYKILYQERIPGRSIYDDLKRLLDESHWVLILAPTGWGKTREAANLAQKLNNEGWTVLKLTRSEWLDAPARFPEDKIGTDRKLLFFLDDLNTKMYGGHIEQSPKADEPLQPLNVSPQDRLLRAIDVYERFCRREDIRVIATARNEKEREFPDEPSEWEKLQFDKYPLWKRFKIYHLPEPNEEAIIGVLTETVPQANIQANPGDYPRLAQRNDRTFRNIVENLRSARNNHQPLALDTFRDTLKGTWKKRYQDAIKKYPAAKYIYDAVDLLRLAGIALYPFIIQPTALLIADGNLWYRLKHWWQIRVAFSYLIGKEQILTPRDGQIEAKGVRLEWNKYVSLLSNLVLKLANKHPKEMLGSLLSFGIELMLLGRYVEAITCYDKALKIQPDDYDAWSLRGYMAANLGRTEEAIAYYDKALSIRPDLHETWHNRGVGLARLDRYEDAIDSYGKALELKPNLYYTWNARGIALAKLKRYEDAIDSYNEAIAIKPDYEESWFNRGSVLSTLGRYEQVVANYDNALSILPNEPMFWYTRSYTLLVHLHRYEEAINGFDKALEIKADIPDAWANRGMALHYLGRYDQAIYSHNMALSINPDFHPAWYNKACCYALQGYVDLAIENLQKAISLIPDKSRQMAKTDHDFDSIRSDERFQALIQHRND